METKNILKEAIEQGVLTFVIFPDAVIGKDKNNKEDFDTLKLKNFLIQYNLKAVPPSIKSQIGGEGKKFGCVIFAPDEYSSNFNLFIRRYGDNGVNPFTKFTEFVERLAKNYGLTENRDYFIVTRKLRSSNAPEGQAQTTENVDRKCLLLNERLLVKDAGNAFIVKVLAQAISKLDLVKYRGSAVEKIFSDKGRLMLMKAGMASVSSLFAEKDDPNKEGKIGVIWRYNSTPFFVIQFMDDIDELYYLVIDAYNTVGGEEIGNTKQFKGIDTYYGLYSLHGEEGSSYGLKGQTPEVWVDYALFNDIEDLNAWIKEAGEDAWSEYEGVKGQMKGTVARDKYRLAAALTGNKLNTEIKDTIDFRPEKFKPAYDEMMTEGTVFNDFINDLSEQIREQFGNVRIEQLTPPKGNVYKQILNKVNNEYANDTMKYGFIDGITAYLIKKYKNTWKNPYDRKSIELICTIGYIKKLIAWYIMQYVILPRLKEMSEGQPATSSALSESFTIDTKDIEHMVLESVKRVLNKEK